MGEVPGSTGVLERAAPPPVPLAGGAAPGRRLRRVMRETVIVLAFVGFYEFLRTDMVQDGSQATTHALSVVRVESALGLFREGELQRLFLRVPDVLKVCNLYYGGTHFVVPAAALVWLALRHPGHYARARTALGVTTALAFAAFWAFPVAPPRLLPPRYGIIDTLVTFQQSGHLEHSLVDSAGDVYAAMPSLHVAWALWCTLALYPVVRNGFVRVLLVAYPFLTTVVVVATGNHFITDAVSGALLVSLVWVVLPMAGAWLTVATYHAWSNWRPRNPARTVVLMDQAGEARRERPTTAIVADDRLDGVGLPLFEAAAVVGRVDDALPVRTRWPQAWP